MEIEKDKTEPGNGNQGFQGLFGGQVLQGHQGNNGMQILPTTPVTPVADSKSILQAMHSFIEMHKDFIADAAKLDGGWEKWLQAALAVHLSKQGQLFQGVRREIPVYSTIAEHLKDYQLLMGLSKPPGHWLRADLVVTPINTTENIVVELKCESAAMTNAALRTAESVARSAQTQLDAKKHFRNYVANELCNDAMKLNIGFRPSENVRTACICVVVTSETVKEAMELWRYDSWGLPACKYEKVDNPKIWLYMWDVGVNQVTGEWEDTAGGHTPEILTFFRDDENGIRQVLQKIKQERQV